MSTIFERKIALHITTIVNNMLSSYRKLIALIVCLGNIHWKKETSYSCWLSRKLSHVVREIFPNTLGSHNNRKHSGLQEHRKNDIPASVYDC